MYPLKTLPERELPFMNTPYLSQFYAFFFLLLFPLFLIPVILELWIWFACRSWHGTATATITEIKKDYRSRGRYGLFKHWFEFPVITYQVEDSTYTKEYPHAHKPLGTYQVGQKLPILYNEKYPKEFIIQGEYSDTNIFSCLFLGPIACIIFLFVVGSYYADYYLGTHELLFEKQTWEDLGASVSGFSDWDYYSTWDSDCTRRLENEIEETLLHFRQIDKKIEEKKGTKSYNDYRRQYGEAADRASRNLADTYAQCISEFLIKCHLDGEEDVIWQSAYAEFLRQLCPQSAPKSGPYSMEELAFMMDIVAAAQQSDLDRRFDPEESIGLFLAVSSLQFHSAAEIFSYNSSIKEKILLGSPYFIPPYLEEVSWYQEYVQRHYDEQHPDAYPPIDPDPVYEVYFYTIEQYLSTGSFQAALWNGSVFAHDQILSRQKADPSLKKLDRYQDRNNPLHGFDPKADPDSYFNSGKDCEDFSPLYLYRRYQSYINYFESRHQKFSEKWK
jgi:hypothetical protein